MQDGGSETDDSRDRVDGSDGNDIQQGDGNPPEDDRVDAEENPWEPPVDHPGKKYERLTTTKEPEGPEDTVPTSDSAPDDSPEVSTALQTKFWVLVLVFNVALLGVSVSAMFLLFERDWMLGSQLFVAGAILFGFGLYRYRQVRRRIGRGEFEKGDCDE